MISMVSEVESITRQYSGLLLPGAFSHLRLQEYEQDFMERLSKHNTIKLLGKSATLLLYSSRYMFRTQFKLYTAAVADDFEVLCVALFTLNRKSDTLEFSKFLVITRHEWNRSTITDETYRSFDTTKLNAIDLTGKGVSVNTTTTTSLLGRPLLSSSLAYSSDSIVLEEEDEHEESNALDVPANQFSLFWLHEALNGDDDDDRIIAERNEYITHYAAFLIDIQVWNRFFNESGNQLKKRMLHHFTSAIGDHHQAMCLLFITQMIEYSSKAMTSRVHQQRKDCDRYHDWFIELCETRFYKQWLEAELFLFKAGSWHKDLLLQPRQIQEHVQFITAHLPAELHNNWLSYTINNNTGLYWIQSSPNQYQVCANWVYKPEFSSLLQSLPMEDGYIYMSTQIFQTVFMPTLYRCILEDVYRCLFFIVHKQADDEPSRALHGLRIRYHYEPEGMKELEATLEACNLSSVTSIYDCVATLRDGNVSNPCVKKLLKKRVEFDLSRKQGDRDLEAMLPWKERVIVRQDLPDIEDLGNKKLVPPCMTKIFKTSEAQVIDRARLGYKPIRLGHKDKINLVRYLIDLAYTKREVIHFLAKEWQNDTSYIVEIANLYDTYSHLKRLNPEQKDSQHHSFGCSSLINVVPTDQTKSNIKCPFADSACKNKVRRKDFTYEEKVVFQKECGSSHSNPLPWGIYHPVQWTLQSIDLGK